MCIGHKFSDVFANLLNYISFCMHYFKVVLVLLIFSIYLVYPQNLSAIEKINIILDSDAHGQIIEGKFREIKKQKAHDKSALKSKKNKLHIFRFRPEITQPGYYHIYAWWPASSNHSSKAVYKIYHSGGVATINVDQRIQGGQWNSLGQFSLGITKSNIVEISNPNGGNIIADAIRFEYIGNNLPNLLIETNTLPIANFGEEFEEQLTASGGLGPYFWNINSALPQGLIFNSKTGILSGIPEKSGTYNLVVQVFDAFGMSTSADVKLHVLDDN